MIPSKFIVEMMLSPSLRAVRLGGIDCSMISVDRTMANHSIKQLGIHRCKKAERLYSLMPSLRAFDGEMNDASAAMPVWDSLQEVSFQVDNPEWGRVGRTFMVCRREMGLAPREATRYLPMLHESE